MTRVHECIVCGRNVHDRARRWFGFARWIEGVGTKSRSVETSAERQEAPEEWPVVAVCLQPCLGLWAESEMAEWEIALRRRREGLPDL